MILIGIILLLGLILIIGFFYSPGLRLPDPKAKRVLLPVVYFVLVYALVNAWAFYLDSYYVQKLNAFDLNGDGLFTGAEITPEQQEAERLVKDDFSRRLAPALGLPLAGFFALVLYGCIAVLDWLRRRLTRSGGE